MSEEVRKQVSQSYGSLIEGRGSDTSYVSAEKIGYSKAILDAIPEGAAASSFGCGNPLAFSGVREGDVVLDLGSGAGLDVLIAAAKVGPSGRAIGVDMTDEMIARARANIAETGATNAEIRKGIIEEMPVEDGSVDWVISNCVINLSPEKPRVFAEIHRVLKPGGRFSISDIVAADLPDWVERSVGMYSACIAGAIDEGRYLQGLRDAGLEDVEVTDAVVYDSDQMRALVESGAVPLPDCLPGGFLEAGLSALEGKVWSIEVSGRKPRA